jgi:hypothetical protein
MHAEDLPDLSSTSRLATESRDPKATVVTAIEVEVSG